jgi:hypothetical protein
MKHLSLEEKVALAKQHARDAEANAKNAEDQKNLKPKVDN